MTFSVVIPLYNKEKTIRHTLECIFAQTLTDYEIVIVNDGSTDGSAAVVESLADPRIRLIHQPNAGVSAARNGGVNEACGKYVAFLDADDEWDSNYLQTQANLISKYPECDVFASDYIFRNLEGTISSTVLRKLSFDGESGVMANYFEVASISHPPLWTSAVVVSKAAFQSVGGFPVGVKSGEDLLTWARLACRYKIAYSRKASAIFNVEGYKVSEQPKRIPADVDVVGWELVKLKREFNPPYIDSYISHWHKMRSSIYMRLGMRAKSVREVLIGLKYKPSNYKLLAYCLINLLPRKFQPF